MAVVCRKHWIDCYFGLNVALAKLQLPISSLFYCAGEIGGGRNVCCTTGREILNEFLARSSCCHVAAIQQNIGIGPEGLANGLHLGGVRCQCCFIEGEAA